MTEVKVGVSEEVFQLALQKALVDALGEDAKARLITDAVKYLTTAEENSYGRTKPPSPLLQAFRQEAEKVAREVVREEMEKTGMRERVRDLMLDAYERMLAPGGRREKLVDRLAEAFAHAMTER